MSILTTSVRRRITRAVLGRFGISPGNHANKKLLSLALFLTFLGWAAVAAAQTVPPSALPIAGLRPTLPTIPERQPRAAQGTEADQQWLTARPPEGSAPVASFIETLKANDAAFEVVLGQGRLLTTKSDIAAPGKKAVIAIGDPTVADFEILPQARALRVIGKRAGVTDLSITTAFGETLSFEVHVVYDLDLLRAQLKQVFPDAHLRLGQIREHLIVEGQARDPAQVSQILHTIEAYLTSAPRSGAAGEKAVAPAPPQIINLIRVPGVHQVLLQVRIAELDRTALREIGADILGVHPGTGNIWGTNIAGAAIDAAALLGVGGLTGSAASLNGTNTTAFGIFPSGDFEILLRALRQNSMMTVLAEPNLIALSGHRASFLAGGQFPIPVPQTGGGISNNVTIEWKDFGVQLHFLPVVLDDGTIRMSVMPEVSSIDETLGTTLVVGGDPVPGVNSRRTETTVEMCEGQTLAIAGLLLVEMDGQTSRIPGLGDLPYIGPLFSNTNHERMEKELLVLVTPYLASPMNPSQVPALPGQEVQDPNDLEFYLLNRIEGRTGCDFRSTTSWDNPLCLVELMKLERKHVCGPIGFSE